MLFEEIIVAVAKNPQKPALFSCQERLHLVKETTKDISNVVVEEFDGLIVDYAAAKGIRAIIRGLRMISDFEYEFQMALTNRKLAPRIETLFLMPHPDYSFISSRLVKEIALLGGDLKEFLPQVCIRALQNKLGAEKKI